MYDFISVKKTLAALMVLMAVPLAGYYAIPSEQVSEEGPATEEITLDEIPPVSESANEADAGPIGAPTAVVQPTPVAATPVNARPVAEAAAAPADPVAEEPPALKPIPADTSNCHVRGSGCEDIEARVEAQWQANGRPSEPMPEEHKNRLCRNVPQADVCG